MKKILFIITIIFFAAMLFLTLFAGKIHESSLPQVTAARPEWQLFPYEFTDENGEARTGSTEKIAVPKSMLGNGVFIIYSAEKNGTKRSFVRLAAIQTGAENGDYVEVVSGIGFSDRIAAKSSSALYDGCEVNIVDKLV